MRKIIESLKDNTLYFKNSEHIITYSLVLWSMLLTVVGFAINWNGNAGFALVFTLIGAILQFVILFKFLKE